MKFPTEMRLFVETPKPQNFIEYVTDQIINGRNINFRKKEAYDMLDLLREKKVQLQKQLDTPVTHEDEIKKIMAEYEAKVRKDFATQDACEQAKCQAQLEIVEELIAEQENLSAQEQNEDCPATN